MKYSEFESGASCRYLSWYTVDKQAQIRAEGSGILIFNFVLKTFGSENQQGRSCDKKRKKWPIEALSQSLKGHA